MYTGFNAKKERKRTKIEKLQDEIKKLHQLLGAMMHVHERMKNERSESKEVEKVPALPGKFVTQGARTEATHSDLPEGTSGEPTSGKDQKGA
jgi:hypothetical protein